MKASDMWELFAAAFSQPLPQNKLIIEILPNMLQKLETLFVEKAAYLATKTPVGAALVESDASEWLTEQIEELLEHEAWDAGEVAKLSALFFLLLITPPSAIEADEEDSDEEDADEEEEEEDDDG